MISIIVPVYNEEGRIQGTLISLRETLEALESDYEIIVVNDGSRDNTLAVIKEIPGIRVVSYPQNRGKGYALRQGIESSRGEYVGFLDGDGEISPHFLGAFFQEITQGQADVVVGKKTNLKRNPLRKVYSLGFKVIAWLLFDLKVETQTGIKLFNHRIRNLNLLNDGFIFDLELLIACNDVNMKVVELPVQLTENSKENRFRIGQVLFMVREIIHLKIWRMACSSLESFGYYIY